MKSDRYGIDKEFCRRNGCSIFFGTDWLDDAEYEAFEAFFGSRQLFVSSADEQLEHSSVSSFSDAVKRESEFVDADKYIFSPNDALIYVSDDRDVFLVAASKERIAMLVDEISARGGRTYSSLVRSGAVEPKKQVKALFDYWADLNFENA
ncbi:hypothetical protein ATU3B_06995 [Agrobacterium genomosp. 3 str. CIP 111-78]|uniref:Uncharacterized protein n=1 Tax=Agrobacterium tumefaciens TaxID=358 RepID=A0AAE6EL96_AGRTU|nr:MULTISPECIES: hypothetical protein [Rhizobium/Agrobacterium group]MCA2371356.1 hypothetical protein [Agrobacterium tomkonis CIP 111-78]MCZ7455562.1 hypothetical protein [Rhizobium rhizogenes]QCM01547.1 hypothetical protein CFBP6624_14930 [Agrobacterium tumefaciens]